MMDEHVKEWIAERIAQELNPPRLDWVILDDLDYTPPDSVDKFLLDKWFTKLLGAASKMDEHVKEWIAERVAQELNPPPKTKIKFEDLDYPEWRRNMNFGVDFSVNHRSDHGVIFVSCT
jgi:hypothetical protein